MALPTASGEAATVGVSKSFDHEESEAERSKIIVEVTGEKGEIVRSMIDMPSGYMPTVTSSIAIVTKALNGSYKTGFQSPASAYGEDLLHSLSNIQITDF
jgi:short subunit dehydrogenase-like uncharacterized protein